MWPLLRSRAQQFRISSPEIFVLAIVLVFGTVIVLMTPLGAGDDEDSHLVRVWQLSECLESIRPVRTV